MENGRQLDVNLYRYSVQEKVTLEIRRGLNQKAVRVTVIERPGDPARFTDMVKPERNLIPTLGILCLDLDPQILQMMPPLRKKGGVLVAARAANAPFETDALEPGDVIHSVNGQAINKVSELRDAITALGTGDAVVFQVERAGQLQFISFEMDL